MKKLLFSLSLSLGIFFSPNLSIAAKPNVIVFLADDAGWGDYGFSGNQQVATPNIDSIGREGVSLDRFFVCPVCAPTRAEFLTGRYHPRGGVTGVSTGLERLSLEEKTVADSLKSAGYATGAYGKWHNGSQWPYHPRARGFDDYFGHTSGHWGEYFDAPLEDNGNMVKTQGYIADVCTDKALTFIEKNKDNPFFCYIPFTTPHSPWTAPEKDWQRNKVKQLTQRATDESKEIEDETRCVYAMMENQDQNVGRVLALLKKLNLSDNTIVVYFSDNGPNSDRWNGGMKGTKAQLDEGGIRSVCYIRWPEKLPSGHSVTQISGAIDLLPTLLALTQSSRVGDKPLDGRDLTPLLQKKDIEWSERTLFTTWAGNISARTQTHRLDAAGYLYDMIGDPGQTKPVNEQEPELTAKLTQAVDTWRAEMNITARSKRKKGTPQALDPRPFTVGYPEFPITLLPARDGEPQGRVRRSSGAPNCSYFVNWTSTDDRLVWFIDVHTTGQYEVSIDYTCPESDAGSKFQLSFQENQLNGIVTPFWDPPLFTNQDTLPRPHGESSMKEFHTLNPGRIKLTKGQGKLILQATDIPGSSVMDLRRISLTLLPD